MSVCGTVALQLKLRGFSWEPGIAHLGPASRSSVITPWLSRADLPTRHAYTLQPGRPTPGCANLLRPPIALQVGAGILTSFPSVTTLVLTLGADSPCADARGAGNLGLTASGTFTRFIATHVSIRTSDTSSSPLELPSPAYGTLSYHPDAPLSTLASSTKQHRPRHRSRGFDRKIIGVRLAPREPRCESSALKWSA